MEDRIRKIEKDTDKLWGEHKMNQLRTRQFESTVEVISKELTSMKNEEVEKAVERQKMNDKLDAINDGIVDYGVKFQDHVEGEMAEYGRIRKVILVMGIMLIGTIVDNQAGTHIISSLWKWAFKTIAGV